MCPGVTATPSDENPDPDFTAGVEMGIDAEDRVIVFDVQRGQLNANDVRNMIRKTAENNPSAHIRIPQDPAQRVRNRLHRISACCLNLPLLQARLPATKKPDQNHYQQSGKREKYTWCVVSGMPSTPRP